MASFCELKTGRDMTTPLPDSRNRKYEIHFPQEYVQYHPWGWGEVPCQLPVARLCHATHDEQAVQICANAPWLHFKAKPKYGKSYEDHNNCGESYCCTPSPQSETVPDADTPRYQPIPDTEPIFPGYYSWWGLVIDQPPNLPWIEHKYLPPYLKSPPESFYGNNAFKSNFSDLLQSYASSRCREGCAPDLYLKMGGTLRYKREIGYVAIVCTSDDLEALKSYSPITCASLDMFNPNGLVDCSGKVIDKTKVPSFTTHYMNTYVSYETLNFAFYFSEEEDFKCHLDAIEVDEIGHEFCIRSTPMVVWFDPKTRKFIRKLVCNQLEKNVSKKEAAISFARKCGVEWREPIYS